MCYAKPEEYCSAKPYAKYVMTRGPLSAARYRLIGSAIDGLGVRFETSGEVELLPDGSVRGVLDEGPIVGGQWGSALSLGDGGGRELVRFVLLYNGALPYEYTFDPLEGHGTWELKKDIDDDDECKLDLRDDERGTLLDIQWTCVETADDGRERDLSSLPGNNACRVRHVSSVPVPCAVCGLEDLSSRLAFFELTVPHFGIAELISFSCGGCQYKTNELRTTEPPRENGVTLTLDVTADTLGYAAVLTDAAVVRCDALDLEARVGTGRYTTAEGLVRGCASALRHARVVSIGNEEGADDQCNEAEEKEGPVEAFGRRVDCLFERCRSGDESFRIVVQDPLGLSFLEGAHVDTWRRSPEQEDEIMGRFVATGGVCGGAKFEAGALAGVSSPSSATVPIFGQGVVVDGSEETPKLLKACEALAAEYTREYLGDRSTLEEVRYCDDESTIDFCHEANDCD